MRSFSHLPPSLLQLHHIQVRGTRNRENTPGISPRHPKQVGCDLSITMRGEAPPLPLLLQSLGRRASSSDPLLLSLMVLQHCTCPTPFYFYFKNRSTHFPAMMMFSWSLAQARPTPRPTPRPSLLVSFSHIPQSSTSHFYFFPDGTHYCNPWGPLRPLIGVLMGIKLYIRTGGCQPR